VIFVNNNFSSAAGISRRIIFDNSGGIDNLRFFMFIDSLYQIADFDNALRFFKTTKNTLV